MNVKDAILNRHSVRMMMPGKTVSNDEIKELLQLAGKSASWSNSQPWEVFVVSGKSLSRLNEIWQEEMKDGIPESRMDLKTPHREDWQKYKRYDENVVQWGVNRNIAAKKMGIDETEWMNDSMRSLVNNYYASALIILGVHESVTTYSHFDLGSFATTFMLAAEEKGYATITAATITYFADRIREVIDVPKDIKLVVGIGLGYADDEHPLNKPETPRNGIEDFTRFFD